MPADRAAASRQAARMAVAATLVLVLAATLQRGGSPDPQAFGWCLLCGERGLADVLANVLLTLPLGAALAFAGVRAGAAVTGCLALSVAIELVQRWLLAGRYPGIGDIAANTAGAACGFALFRMRFVPRFLAWRGAGAAAVLAVLAMLGTTTLLMTPVDAPHPLYGSWTPVKRGWDVYDGRVLGARVGSVLLPSERLEQPRRVQRLLRDGTPLELDVIAGTRASGLAYLFGISALDAYDQVVFAQLGHDLLVIVHTRGDRLRLHQPALRYAGVMARPAGDTVALSWRAERSRWCLTADGRPSCAGWTVGRGWSLLGASEPRGTRWLAGADAAWIALLLIPVGAAPRRRLALLASLMAVAMGLLLVPYLGGLLPTPPLEWVGAVAGAASGVWLRRFALPVTPRLSYNSPADVPQPGAG